jgi:hypothetical protein
MAPGRKIGDAFVSVREDMTGFRPGVQRGASEAGTAAGKSFHSSFLGSIKGIATGAAALIAGGAVIGFFKDSIAEQRESIRVGKLTAQVLKSTGSAARVTAGQVGDLATRLSNLSGIDDEVIQSGENVLLTFTNIRNSVGRGNDIFNQATTAALDMSVALGTDLQGSVIQVGKALNDPIKGITALQRVGVSFTEKQKEQIKTLVATGHTMQAQKLILQELKTEFGGAAAAAADPAQKAQVAWGNFKEQIGGLVLPIVTQLADKLTTALPHAADVIGRVFGVVGPIIVNSFIRPVQAFITQHGDEVRLFFTQLFDRFRQVDVDKLGKTVAQVAGLAAAFATVRAAANNPLLTLLGMLTARYPKETADVLASVSGALSGVVSFVAANPVAVRTLTELLLAYKGLQALRSIKLPDLFTGAAGAAKTQAGAGAAMNKAANTQAAAAAEMLTAARAQAGAGLAAGGAGVAAGSGWKVAAVASAAKFSGYFVAALNALSFGESIIHVIRKGFSGFDIVNIITAGLLGNVVNVSSTIVKAMGMDSASVDRMVSNLKANFFGQLGSFFSTQLPNALLTFLSKGTQSHGGWSSLGTAIINGIKSGISDALIGINDWVKGQVDKILNGFKKWLGISSPSTVFMVYGRQIIAGLLIGLAQSIGSVVSWFVALPGRMRAALGNIAGYTGNWGRDVINGLWAGLRSAWDSVMRWFGSIPGWVKAALGIHSPPAWAVDAGGWIMKGLIKGLIGGSFDVTHFLGHFTKLAQTKLASMFGGGGGGAFAHRLVSGQLLQWISLAEQLTGVGPSWTQGLITLIMRESGGNPRAINLTDINAQRGDPSRGLMQTIGSTFAHYRLPFLPNDIYNPLSNIVAGIRYILARYGSIFRVQQANPNLPPRGYDQGGLWATGTVGINTSGRTEMVTPASTMDDVVRLLARLIAAVERVAPGVGEAINGAGGRVRVMGRAG